MLVNLDSSAFGVSPSISGAAVEFFPGDRIDDYRGINFRGLTDYAAGLAVGALVVTAAAGGAAMLFNKLNIGVGETTKEGESATELTDISPLIRNQPFFRHVMPGIGIAEDDDMIDCDASPLPIPVPGMPSVVCLPDQLRPAYGAEMGEYVAQWMIDTTGVSIENAVTPDGQPAVLVTIRDEDGERVGFDLSTVVVTAKEPKLCKVGEDLKRLDPACGGDPSDPFYSGWYTFVADPGVPENSAIGQKASMAARAFALDTECFTEVYLNNVGIGVGDERGKGVAEMLIASWRKSLALAYPDNPIPPEAVYVDVKADSTFQPTRPLSETLVTLHEAYPDIVLPDVGDGVSFSAIDGHCAPTVEGSDGTERDFGKPAEVMDTVIRLSAVQPGTIVTAVDGMTGTITTVNDPARVSTMLENLPQFSETVVRL